MKAQEFTAKRRQTVKLPDGSEFKIRRIGVVDLLVAGGNADLLVFLQKYGRSAKSQKEFTEKTQEMFERIQKSTAEQRKFCEALIRRGLVEPKIGGEDGLDLADLTHEECDILGGGVLKFSGFTKEAAEAVAPLSRTGSSSKTSTPSPDATEPPQASSSDSETSKPTPSTPPAPGPDSSESNEKPSE